MHLTLTGSVAQDSHIEGQKAEEVTKVAEVAEEAEVCQQQDLEGIQMTEAMARSCVAKNQLFLTETALKQKPFCWNGPSIGYSMESKTSCGNPSPGLCSSSPSSKDPTSKNGQARKLDGQEAE